MTNCTSQRFKVSYYAETFISLTNMSKNALAEHVAHMEIRNLYWHFGGKKTVIKSPLEYWEGKIVSGN